MTTAHGSESRSGSGRAYVSPATRNARTNHFDEKQALQKADKKLKDQERNKNRKIKAALSDNR